MTIHGYCPVVLTGIGKLQSGEQHPKRYDAQLHHDYNGNEA